jgi:hypothetical protein
MSCPAMTFSDLTPEKYAALAETAKARGLDISAPAGETTYQGFEFTWNYDAAAQALTLQCTAKPFFVPCSMIEQKIRELIR